jgi:hypothetical protein
MEISSFYTRGVARSAPNASEADEVHKQDEVHMYERETSKGTKGKCTSRRFGVWCKNLAEMDELPSRWYTTPEDTVSIGDFLTRYQNTVC